MVDPGYWEALRTFVLRAVAGLPGPLKRATITAVNPDRTVDVTWGEGTDPMTDVVVAGNYSPVVGDRAWVYTDRGSSIVMFTLRPASADASTTGVLAFAPRWVGEGEEPPAAGDHEQGDLWRNTNPLPGGNVAWVCTSTGTPGTWRETGAIAS